MVSCGGGGSKQPSGSATPETKTETVGNSSLEKAAADLFPGSGLTGFVPAFAVEVKADPNKMGASFLIKQSGASYNDSDLTNEQYNEWIQTLFARVKTVSEDGKVYKYDRYKYVATDEVTEIPPQDKNQSYSDGIAWKHNGKWWHLIYSYFMSYSKEEQKPGVKLYVNLIKNQ
jgi:hypothetical protein